MWKVVAYLSDEHGASAAEYALILAIVGTAIATAAIFLATAIGAAVNSAGTCISSAGSNC